MAIIGLVLIDLVFGLVFLCLLLMFLGGGLDLWGMLLPETLPLDRRDYWQAARADFWAGFTLWFMVLTTLLPTILHLSLGLSAVLTHRFRRRAGAVRRLRDATTSGAMSDADRTDIAKRLARAQLFHSALEIVTLLVLFTAGVALILAVWWWWLFPALPTIIDRIAAILS